MNSSFQRFSHSVAYWVTSAVGLSSLKPFSITSGGDVAGRLDDVLRVEPAVAHERRDRLHLEKSTGVAIAARLRIGISGWRAAESSESTPPKQ